MKVNFYKILLFFLVLNIIHANKAVVLLSATYYVSPNGAATWGDNTSIDNPSSVFDGTRNFLTKPVAGDTIIFLDGVYGPIIQDSFPDPGETGAWVPTNSGVVNQPITYKSLNRHSAKLIGKAIGSGSVNARIWGTHFKDYIVIDGFQMSGFNFDGSAPVMPTIDIRESEGCFVRNCEFVGISHANGGAINYEGIRIHKSSNIIIENCKFNNYLETSVKSPNTSAIKTFYASNATIKNCEFYNNTVDIFLKGYPHNDIKIINNFFTSNINIMVSQGVAIIDNRNPNSSNLTLQNNIFFNSILNVDLSTNKSPCIINNIKVFNNLSLNGLFEWAGAEINNGPEVYNNIFASEEGVVLRYRHNFESKIKYSDFNAIPYFRHFLMRDYGDRQLYQNINLWQNSNELFDGSHPDLHSVNFPLIFVNSSGSMSHIADFLLKNSDVYVGMGRFNSNIGPDVSLIGIK